MRIVPLSYYHSAHKANNKETVYSKSGLDSNDIKTVIEERLSENESQPLKLTDEQKNYLKEKYDLEEMTFPINYTSSSVTDSFMKDLYEMGIITERELRDYSEPVRPMRKPANYNSLPDDIKKNLIFVEDPLIPEDQIAIPASHVLEAHISGENIRDAFEILAVQQKRYSEIALGENSKNMYLENANMYNKLLDILDEIYG
ncbi:hypothetical protein [Extibacter muris]|uniref:hypothetical protein n=1 Tax=Extibacter muris TaxID=1796622 RepID=UPI001D080648|nr:hypothetical protein [Extibacter muris]MCB6203230.1 hypothetical protein [Extibacter muris]MCQ4664826.1 hypothetical protein [Extibacter muris]MCQ4694835.1 hypothetical protein [Extibacter muris]